MRLNHLFRKLGFDRSYQNDILISSYNREEDQRHLEEFFSLLQAAKLQVNSASLKASIHWLAYQQECLAGRADTSNIAISATLDQQLADGTWAPLGFFSRELSGLRSDREHHTHS